MYGRTDFSNFLNENDSIVCKACNSRLSIQRVRDNQYICYACDHYFPMGAWERIHSILDTNSFEIWYEDMETPDPLQFPNYQEKIELTRKQKNLSEAVVVGKGTIQNEDVVFGILDTHFFMGSMGYVVGERITLAIEAATKRQLPLVLFCCSGGARMQEGIIALMQMAKTVAALKKFMEQGGFYISVLTDPTMGGVTASFAMLGDIVLAEPKATIGFAGQRVIEQTMGENMPEEFQTSEFQLQNGFIDAIVERKDLRKTLGYLLRQHNRNLVKSYPFEFHNRGNKEEATKDSEAIRSAWEKVKLSRKVNKNAASNYINLIFDDFMELHGDKVFGDDEAIMGGIASLDGIPVTVIGVVKGAELNECVRRNFGMPMPEGYRKVIRLMKEAEKFHRPIVLFVNTPGASCGVLAEKHGQGRVVAECIQNMFTIKSPILSIIIGEAGSGGALALSIGDEVWMLENSIYGIISPEGFASILWKAAGRAEEASELMKITAQDLFDMHIIDKIIPEDGDAVGIARNLKCQIMEFLREMGAKDADELLGARYRRFRKF